MLEKFSLPPVQCLFCNHLNPTGARFCNDCGSQLHLQPCDRCGATNKRTAKTCYKCGAGFTLPGTPGLASESVLLAPQPTPDPPPVDPPGNEVSIASEQTPLPEFVAPPTDDTASPSRWATAISSRRAVRITAAAILLVAIVMSGEYYSERSVEFTKTQGVIPFAPHASSVAAAPVLATQPGTSSPGVPTAQAAVNVSELDKTLSLAPPGAGVASGTRPLPAPEAEVMPQREPPVFRECTDVIAALGFCNPPTKTEGK